MKIKLLSKPQAVKTVEVGKVYRDKFKHYWIISDINEGYISATHWPDDLHQVWTYTALREDDFKNDKLELIGVIL